MKIFLVTLLILPILLVSEEISRYDFKQALLLSLKQNPFYQAEQLNVNVAKTDLITSRILPNPAFNNQTLVRQRPGGSGMNTGFTFPSGVDGSLLNPGNRQDWFQVTQSIPVAGQRQHGIDLALRKLNLSYKNLEEYERNLLLLVANQWLEVWLAKERLNIIMRTKEFSDELLKVNQVRLKNEVITSSEFLRTLNLVEQYDADLLRAKQNLINETRNLQFLLGSEKEVAINSEDLFFSLNESYDYDKLYEYAVTHRTDISVNRAEQEVAKANINLQESLAYPRPEVGMIYNPQNGEPYIGSYLTLPIPVFNRNQGEIQKSKVILNKTQVTYNALQQKLSTEIKNALGNLDVSRLNYEKYKKISQTAESVLATVKYSYVKGGTTIIDYLEAQRTWFESQNLYYDSIVTYRRSVVELFYYTGKIRDL